MVEIKYCGIWNYQPEALRVRDQLSSLGHEDIKLLEGSGGIFEIRIDGKTVFSKVKNSCGGFPTSEEIIGFR